MKRIIKESFRDQDKILDHIILNFDKHGKTYGNQKRNSLKLFNLNGQTINVKSFKIPNFINQVVYRFFRKSKAQRSFEHANILLDLGIGTPGPIAYFEFTTPFLFKKSYYISKHLEPQYTFRDLTYNFDIPGYEEILRAFTRFTFRMHEKNVLFLDHSQGNTLIYVKEDHYEFYLVDLNRMKFKALGFEERMKNFSRLANDKKIVQIMSNEYAKCMGKDFDEVYNLMWEETQKFWTKHLRKKRIKKKLKL